MKFDTNTLQILKNFATINPSIVFKPGSVISTVSPTKTILARATIDQEIETEFGIGDLSRFLSTLSLFETPTIKTTDTALKIAGSGRNITYRYTSTDVIMSPPDKEINFDPEVEFKLEGVEFQELTKALSVLMLPEVAVVGDGKKIQLQAVDTKNPSADSYSVEVGETTDIFNMIFLAENLKIMPGSYDVSISSQGLSRFKSDRLQYLVAVESNSTFG